MAFLGDFFGRLGRVARGQANAGVDVIEDATFEATVRQTVADMKTELNKVVRASAMAMSNYNTLQAEYEKYVRQSEEWKQRAGMALDAGNEELAKKALAKKAECDQQVNSMKLSVEQAQATSEKLKQQVGELKHKIDDGERTAGTLVARKNAAMAQRKVSEAIAGVGSADNAFAALNRFEQTVSKEEATAKAFDQLASAGKDDDLEKQFAALGTGNVDSELAALKAERAGKNLQPPTYAKELPAPGTSYPTGSTTGEKAKA
ncbi:MAG TPA: PspA/IM30 family protein [Candidatus Acidoferrum sp.]|nr:PspA/IM30 family protein [Candidatus Acidoferrum sp.]